MNLDKHHIEKRHNQRFLGIFLMFAVIAVFLGFMLAFSLKPSVTGNSFLGIDWAWTKPVSSTESAGASLKGIPIASCTDSDGGIVPYVKGTVRYNGSSYTDYCWDNWKNATKSNDTVEFYCMNNKVNATLVHCPGGCYNGACLNYPTPAQFVRPNVQQAPNQELQPDVPAVSCFDYCIKIYGDASFCYFKCVMMGHFN